MIPAVPKERIQRAQFTSPMRRHCFEAWLGLPLPTHLLISFATGKNSAVAVLISPSVSSPALRRSAVLSAAYRHCAKMEFEREARVIDYTPSKASCMKSSSVRADGPEWLRSMIADRSVAGASEAFWNKVEAFEKRSDAQLAKDVTIALPIELACEQNIALMRDFVERHITSKGMSPTGSITTRPAIHMST